MQVVEAKKPANRIAGTHFFAEGIQLIQILEYIYLIRLGNRTACEIAHITHTIDDFLQVGAVLFHIKVAHIEPGCFVSPILHPRGK